MTQYVPLGELAAPADWVIPPSLEIVPVAIYAGFDGSGGAAEFVPCLDIISDSGHTVGRYPASVTVAANSFAEVSWAPFLKGGAGAASGTPSLAYAIASSVRGDTEQQIASGVTASITYHRFETSDASLFSLAGGGLGVNTSVNMLLQAQVIYEFDYSLVPPAEWVPDESFLDLPIGFADASPYVGYSGWTTGQYSQHQVGMTFPINLTGCSSTRVGKTDAGLVSPVFTNNWGSIYPIVLLQRLLLITCLALT